MDDTEAELLATMGFPAQNRAGLLPSRAGDPGNSVGHRGPIERLNSDIKRGSHVVGIFANEAAVTGLIAAILLGQNAEWAV